MMPREIITSPHPICGQELRFIRSMLDLSQEGMGKIIGVQRLQVTLMEACGVSLLKSVRLRPACSG